MGPWSTGKKNTSTTEDVMVHRQGPAPQRQGPGRPSRAPGQSGVNRSNSRPQDGEHEDRGHQAPRQVVVSPRGGSEGQPEGRAVARSHGRPGPAQPKRPPPATAARGPEASTSHHHAAHVPRQQTGASTLTHQTPPSAAAVRYPVSQNERIRTQSNNSDPRTAGTMRNKRDSSPVKNVHNMRSYQGTMGGHTRAMGRAPAGLQPGPVSARGGVPRPARPPAPSQPQSLTGKKPGPGSSQEHRRGPAPQHVTSSSTDRNTPLPITDDAIRSGQQMVIVPTSRHKGQNRPNQSQSAHNDAVSTSSKAQNPSRTSNTANTDQSRLPNHQGLRTDARLQGPSRQIVQKAGNNNKTSRNINSDVHSSQRTNNTSDVIAAPDTNRHSSSSSNGDSNVRNTSSSNTRHKQKNKTSKRDYVKPENVNNDTRTLNISHADGSNPDTREGNREASGSSSGPRNTPRSALSTADNPATNSDNPVERQVQRPDDTHKNNSGLAADSQVLRPRQTPQGGALGDQQRQDQGQRSSGDQSGHSDRGESLDRNTGATNVTGNSRIRSQATSHTTRQSDNTTAPSMGSSEGPSDNSPTEGRGEGAGGGGQSSVSGTVGGPAGRVDREQGHRQKSNTNNKDRSTSREMVDRTQQQRSSGQRSGLNEGSGMRSQRTPGQTPAGSGDPGSSNTARNSRATNRSQSQPQSANAPSNSAPTANNVQDSANNVVSPQRTEVNNGIRNNTTSSNNRAPVQNRTTMAANNSGTRPSNAQNNASRATAVQNIASGTSSANRPSGQTRANNGANNSGARDPNQSRANRSTSAEGNNSGGTSHQQQRSAQSGAVLDPSQLNIDIMDNSVSECPPPYATLDVNTSGARRNRNNRPVTSPTSNSSPNQALPDILNSHVHPPRQNESRTNRRGVGAGVANNGARRNRTQSAGRQPPRAGTTRLDSTSSSFEGCSKWGCLRCLTILTTFRWILITLALLGVACVLTGIVLGALHMTIGSSFLTLSLMFIGLGVMLVIVVGVGWKCTPRGHEPCHLLFNLGDHSASWNDIHVQSTARSRNNPRNQWVGGTIYDEFQYRRPPPSYNASMQEYQQQLVLAQIRQSTQSQGPPGGTPNSPPPTYKSHASTVRPGLHITFPIPQGDDYPSSRPPTYRSTAGTLNRPRINTNPAQGENENERIEETNNRSSESNQDQIMNEINNSHSRPDTPASSSLTLQRANQVVNYLDDVLDNSLREMDRENRGGNAQGSPDAQSANQSNSTTVQITNASSADTETVNRDSAITNSDNDTRRNSTTTTATTSSSSSSSSSGSTTSNATSEGSSRNSSGSHTSGDTSHIVADTHL